MVIFMGQKVKPKKSDVEYLNNIDREVVSIEVKQVVIYGFQML